MSDATPSLPRLAFPAAPWLPFPDGSVFCTESVAAITPFPREQTGTHCSWGIKVLMKDGSADVIDCETLAKRDEFLETARRLLLRN